MGIVLKYAINILCVFFFVFVFGQTSRYTAGADAKALGEAVVSSSGVSSFFYNPAGTCFSPQPSIFIGYENRYELRAFQSISFASLMPIRQFSLGVGAFRFGDEVFNNQLVKLTISHKLQQISLGLGAGFVQQYTESIGSFRKVLVEFGGLISLTPTFSIGAHIFNFASTDAYSPLFLPTILRVGSRLDFSKELAWFTEVEGIPDEKPIFRSGIHYQPVTFLTLRAGLHTTPIQFSGGVGVLIKALRLDYAYSEHAILGGEHAITLILSKKEK